MSDSRQKSTIKAISLFSGLGGLDIGLHQAGVETVACVEKEETAAETLKTNSRKHETNPSETSITVPRKYSWKVLHENIRDIDGEDILAEADVKKSEIDLVVGGPPCQTFSRSNEGSRSGTEADRGKLFQEYARILHELEPEGFIFENVRGLQSSNNGEDLEKVLNALQGEKYNTKVKLLNAANYGVPQTRKRLIILGTKKDNHPEFPEPTHSEDGENKPGWVSVGEALNDFTLDKSIEKQGGYTNAIGSKYGHLLKDIPEGANYQHFSERKYDPEQNEYVERTKEELKEKEFDWRSRHWNYLLKIERSRPSWTLQASPGTTVGPFHWRARDLSLLEQMELMTIPRDYYIAGNPSDIQRQIGNAVPPKLAERISVSLLKSLNLTTDKPDISNELETQSPEQSGNDFRIEAGSNDSPWELADRIRKTVETQGAVVIEAEQQAIPYALDAVEIAKDQSGIELEAEINEHVTRGEQEKGGATSTLETQIISKDIELQLSLETKTEEPIKTAN
jgi:DNA (cytosine-5)-methyltransferase 1